MTVAMDSALSGLRAAQQALGVVSNNIANASTEGYTRKILPTETLLIAGVGFGVSMQAISRNVDNLLVRDLAIQSSITENRAVTQKYLDRVAQFNGSSDSNQSLSASISRLAQSFSELSSSPSDLIGLQKTLTAARATANRFNNFSKLINDLRNQAETEIAAAIGAVNDSLARIADLNSRIVSLQGAGASTAELEDKRDTEIRNVAKYIEVSTYPNGNGGIVVTTKNGQTLAEGSTIPLVFDPSSLLPTSSYPSSGINAITVGGIDITSAALGGGIGALIDLRDNILPTYNAQLDEVAHKLALRMESQGLRLFTDLSGAVPADVAGGYVGFASQIKVNDLITADPSLIRSGTNGNTVQAGSNEVIRKVAQFAFGTAAWQEADGTADISAGTVFTAAGLQPYNRVAGNTNIAGYTPALTANPDIVAGLNFSLTIGGVPQVIAINPGDTAANLASNINTAFGTSVASLNGLGQLVITSSNTIAFANGTLGAAGLAALGFTAGATLAQNPSFTVQVGTQAPVTITIGPADTAANLLANLNAISGLTATLNGGGGLHLVPAEGGDLKITDGVGTPLALLGVTVSNMAHAAFRQTGLGPSGTLSTGLLANATLEEYTRSIITGQSEDARSATNGLEKEETYFQLLDKRHKDNSGVNIDEEMALMIRIQSNYAAAAKMLSTSEKMLDALLNAF